MSSVPAKVKRKATSKPKPCHSAWGTVLNWPPGEATHFSERTLEEAMEDLKGEPALAEIIKEGFESSSDTSGSPLLQGDNRNGTHKEGLRYCTSKKLEVDCDNISAARKESEFLRDKIQSAKRILRSELWAAKLTYNIKPAAYKRLLEVVDEKLKID